MSFRSPRTLLTAATLVTATVLTGCAEQLANVGRPPQLSNVQREDIPSPGRADRPVRDDTRAAETKKKAPDLPGTSNNPRIPEAAKSAPSQPVGNTASLWRAGRHGTTLFSDQRARHEGDILTVTFDVEDEAVVENETTRSRSTTENVGVDALLGYEQAISKVFPEAADAGEAASVNAESSYSGEGETDRTEEIEFEMAAMVVDVLPSGHFVIRGRQEIRVNYELRDLQVSGIVRPQDIGRDNTISYTKIAEARVSYGGRGDITNVQQPRYGQQVLDAVLPF